MSSADDDDIVWPAEDVLERTGEGRIAMCRIGVPDAVSDGCEASVLGADISGMCAARP